MSRSALRLAVSNGIVRESPRPVAVELRARPAVTAPPARARRIDPRPALNLVLWLACVVLWLAALAFLPE